MEKDRRVYAAIDLKSFYASVECRERGLDPLKTHLVVADASRTQKTICLAVSPALKAYGIPGRPRLFEVMQKTAQINAQRRLRVPGGEFAGASSDADELQAHPEYELAYITAVPRMARYMEYSTRIYEIYLKYIAPEDIHVYSIDEVMMDVTDYLRACGMDARELVRRIIRDIYRETGITATAGIGTNLYLCKVAMDIQAKHAPPDEAGVRMACLDEVSYRQQLWDHRPLTDFWRVGRGYAKKLAEHGMFTMGDVARCSMGKWDNYHNEELLYRLFGVNAELLIDHAWGWEPCTIADIKAYRPQDSSVGSGQVLHCPYEFEKARLVTREMAEQLALSLVERHQVTDQMVLTVGYDVENLKRENIHYQGKIKTDHYGRKVPGHAHGTVNLPARTSSAGQIADAVLGLYDRIVDRNLLVRRITISANKVVDESVEKEKEEFRQLRLFDDYDMPDREKISQKEALDRERRMQEAMLHIRRKFGNNAILKGSSLQEGATARMRNQQIGGHRA